jgi:hypothetical protein
MCGIAGIYNLSNDQLIEWAILDTFDWYAPAYDNPQSTLRVKQWFEDAAFTDIYIGHHGHLVARGEKPRSFRI